MANISRKISRSVSRIISRGLGSTIASYFARFFTTASTWVGELLKSSVGDLTLEPTGRWCFEGDGTGYLTFAGLAAYDSITVNRQGVGDEAITLTGGNWTPTLGESYNDVKFYNGATLVHHFPLDNFKPASTPSVVEYPDKIGGAKATLVNGAPAVNLSARTDVSRSNNLLGFSPTLISNGIDDSCDISGYNFDGSNIEIDTAFYYNGIGTGVYRMFFSDGSSFRNLDCLVATNDTLKVGTYTNDGYQSVSTQPINHGYNKLHILFNKISGDISVNLNNNNVNGNFTGNWSEITTHLTLLYEGAVNRRWFSCSLLYFNIKNDGIEKKLIFDFNGNMTDGSSNYSLSGTGFVEHFIPINSSGYLVGSEEPPTNPAVNNGKGYNGCEQTYRCPDIPKEKDQDDIWKSADGLTVNDVNVGTLNDGDNGNIEIVKDANGNVSDLKIK